MGSAGTNWDSGDVITTARLNQKTITADTGANCTADTKYAGQVFMPTSTNGSFTQDIPTFILPSDGTTVKQLATTDATQTLTNKTIDDDSNTISNLDADSTKAGFFGQIHRKADLHVAYFPYAVSANWVQSNTSTGSCTFTYSTGGNEISISTGATSGSRAAAVQTYSNADLADSFFMCQAIMRNAASQRQVVGLFHASAPTADTVAGYGFRVTDTGNIFAINGNGASSTTTDTSQVSESNPHTLMAVYNSSSIKFYIDGVLKATHTTNLPSGAGVRNFYAMATNSAAADKTLTLYMPVQVGMTGA